MPDLATQLAALGIPPPTELHITAPAVVDLAALARVALVDPADPGDDLELHDVLSTIDARVRARLAKNGIGIVVPMTPPPDRCIHQLVVADPELAALICQDCKLPVSPMWWLSMHAALMHRAALMRIYLGNENERLGVELQSARLELTTVRRKIQNDKRRLDRQRRKVAHIATGKNSGEVG